MSFTLLSQEVIDTELSSVCILYAEILMQHIVRNKLHPPCYIKEDRHVTFATHRALKLLTICLGIQQYVYLCVFLFLFLNN